MRRISISTLMAGFLAAAAATAAEAQKPAAQAGGFGLGYTDLGPTVGLGGLGDAGLSFGGRFERAIKALPNLGNGILAFQLSADYYHYSADVLAVDYGFSYIPIGATANYHIHVNNRKFDPFVGAGLGYSIVSTSFAGNTGSGFYFIGRGGLRYYMSSGLALYGDVGAGAATLNLGVMFRMAKSH
jgi:hypothetical protein